MAIQTDITNTSPMTNQLFMATKLDGNTIGSLPEGVPVDFCYCHIECDYNELAVAKIGGTNRENDTSAFLFSKFIAADTITFKLFKNGKEIATISDDTYGEYFPAGSLTVVDNPASALYVGFRVDWEKVLTVEGVGIYEIKAETVFTGSSKTFSSHKYRLVAYSDAIADGTVRIRTTQNGNIESLNLDYTGLNWQQTIRIPGKLFGKTPTLESDRYVDAERRLRQIQDSIVNTYTLETRLLPDAIASKLIYDLFLSNRILVTDYNILNEDIVNCEKTYNDIELYPDEIEEPQHFNRITRRLYRFRLVDRIQNTLKRNF